MKSHSLSDPKKTSAFSAPPHRFVVPAVAEAEADTVASVDETETAAAVVVVSENEFGAAGSVVQLA